MDLYHDHQSVRKDIRELQHVGLIDESEDGVSLGRNQLRSFFGA